MTPAPIFIVGCPRSGTTLLRQILNRHPSLAICPETHFQRLVYSRRKAFGDLSNLDDRRALVSEYLSTHAMNTGGFNLSDLAEKLQAEATSYQAMFTALLRQYAASQGKTRCGEKTPQHAMFLETLCDWFPNAVILHMVRDPRATAASLRQVAWSGHSVVAKARLWLKYNQSARRFRDHPGYLEVRYEALVVDPARELRNICSFIQEEYCPSMLVPSAGAAGSSAKLPRQAVTAERRERWRQELNADQVSQIEWVLKSEMEGFGYTREALPASAVTVARGLSDAALDRARFVLARLPAVWYRLALPRRLAKYDYWAGPKIWRKNGSSVGKL